MRVTDVTAEQVAAETERVVATAGSFRNDAVLAPSLCPGWSRGHVLSHLARNAEGLERVCAAVLSGTNETMYASDEERNADVEAGARRSANDLADDVRTTAESLAKRLVEVGPEHAGRGAERTPGGRRVPVELVPYLRLRELVYHHVDLDAGFGFDHLSPDLVLLFLERSVANLQDSSESPGLTLLTDEGETFVVGDRATTVHGTRAGLLLWLARGDSGEISCETELPTLPEGI